MWMVFYAVLSLGLAMLAALLIYGAWHRGKILPPPADIENRRRHPRLPVQIAAEAVAPGGARVSGQTRDLSVSGMFLVASASAPLAGECAITLLVARDGSPIRFSLRGQVVRAEAGGLAFTFTAMDSECYENLCYLVHYNAEAQQTETPPEGGASV